MCECIFIKIEKKDTFLGLFLKCIKSDVFLVGGKLQVGYYTFFLKTTHFFCLNYTFLLNHVGRPEISFTGIVVFFSTYAERAVFSAL